MASQRGDASGRSVVAKELSAAPCVLSSAIRAWNGDGDGRGPLRSNSANEMRRAYEVSLRPDSNAPGSAGWGK